MGYLCPAGNSDVTSKRFRVLATGHEYLGIWIMLLLTGWHTLRVSINILERDSFLRVSDTYLRHNKSFNNRFATRG